jgi:hypothetical protein
VPLYCTMVNACETDSPLVRNERHYLMDKKNDHSCKHSQRDSFIDARATNYCNAFHSLPPIQTTALVPTCCHAALLR